jgi:cell division protein FtsW
MQRQTTILLNVVLSLLLMGVLMVYSTSVVGALSTESSALFYRHLLYACVGIALMVVAARLDYHFLLRPVIYRALFVGAFVLLGLVLIPGIGVERGGAQRWILLGGVTFQPSEFAKLALIVFLAVKLCQNQEHIRTFRAGFFPPVAVTGVVALLIVCERDLGMPIVICATAFLMLLMAGARWSHMLLGLVPGAAAVAWGR